MPHPTYRSILRESWSLTVHRPALWFFGLCAGITGTTVAAHVLLNFGDSFKRVLPLSAIITDLLRSERVLFNGAQSTAEFIAALTTTLFVLALLALLIYLAVTSVSVVVQTAAFGKKNAAIAAFWGHGLRHFWPLFALVVVRLVATGLALYGIAVGADFAVAKTDSLVPLLYLPFGIALLGIALLLAFISIFASAAIVVDEERFFAALKKGWATFVSHWLVSIEVTAILFLFELLALLVFVGVTVVFAGIAYGLTLFSLAVHTPVLVPALLSILSLGAFLFILWVQAVVTTFEIAAWTKLYLIARKTGVVSRLVHLFHRTRHLASL